ncbi:MAG: hypothetical protein ACI93R_003613 [Flavobacteriales bacterium]|jgi:hypothetical protein
MHIEIDVDEAQLNALLQLIHVEQFRNVHGELRSTLKRILLERLREAAV